MGYPSFLFHYSEPKSASAYDCTEAGERLLDTPRHEQQISSITGKEQ